MIDHRGSVGADPTRSSGYAPLPSILKAGYAFASFKVADVAPDSRDGYRGKMINLFHPANQALPRRRMVGATAMDSTLLTVVGQP